MKTILVASMAALLGLGMSGGAEAHDYRGYAPAYGGAIYLTPDSYAFSISYGVPYARPYYLPPPRYAYYPKRYKHAYYHGKHRGYGEGYRKGYRHGHHHGRHGGWDRDRRRWDDDD